LTSFVNLNKVTEINKQLTGFLIRIFDLDIENETLPNPTVDLSYDSTFKLLARLYVMYMKSLNSTQIEESIKDLLDFVKILSLSSELKKNLLDKLECFPNQLYKLCAQNIKIDEILDEEFKDAYLEIIERDIREDMLILDFNPLISHTDKITGVQLGSEIELAINENKTFLPINDENSDSLPTLISLIEKCL
jgi:hypothetical protein